METALVMRSAGYEKRAGRCRPALLPGPDGSGRLLLAQRVDELDQLDGAIPILGRGGMEALLLTVGEAVERSLVLGWRVGERFGNRCLQVFGQIRIVRVRSVDDRRRLV